jgi:hypothetical protein
MTLEEDRPCRLTRRDLDDPLDLAGVGNLPLAGLEPRDDHQAEDRPREREQRDDCDGDQDRALEAARWRGR